MKITNKSGLPETFVKALKHSNEQYQGKNYGKNITVTNLLDDPHIRNLKLKHKDEIEVDVSDMTFALFGNAFHNIMQNGARENDLIECRLEEKFQGWNINGAFDYYDSEEKIVYDYKVTSVWSYIYKSRMDKWQEQLNIYAWLLQKAGFFEVNGVANILIFRDWSKSKADKKEDYPDSQILVVNHELMSTKNIERLLYFHIQIHNIENTKACRPENRWKDPDQWAVHKPLKSGKGYYKRATKLCDTEDQAVDYAEKRFDDYKIEFRKGENKRCKYYCNVGEFCPFYQNKIKGGKHDT